MKAPSEFEGITKKTFTGNDQRKHVTLLLLLSLTMFGFAFALVPLYDVFCALTGLNGRIPVSSINAEPVAQDSSKEVSTREVTIQFLAHVGRGLPWEFSPVQSQKLVRVGESYTIQFYVRNRAEYAVTGQAIPSVSPGLAAQHLFKTECFCFTQQRLAAGEEMEMPVTFIIDSELPEEIQTLSLSYTLFVVEKDNTI